MKYFHFGIIRYQDFEECFQHKSSLTVSLVAEVNYKNARIQVEGDKKSNALVLSGHLHPREELGQQSTVATVMVGQPTLPAEWPSFPLLIEAVHVVLIKVNALKERGSNYVKQSHRPSQHHGDTKYTFEINVLRG